MVQIDDDSGFQDPHELQNYHTAPDLGEDGHVGIIGDLGFVTAD